MGAYMSTRYDIYPPYLSLLFGYIFIFPRNCCEDFEYLDLLFRSDCYVYGVLSGSGSALFMIGVNCQKQILGHCSKFLWILTAILAVLPKSGRFNSGLQYRPRMLLLYLWYRCCNIGGKYGPNILYCRNLRMIKDHIYYTQMSYLGDICECER